MSIGINNLIDLRENFVKTGKVDFSQFLELLIENLKALQKQNVSANPCANLLETKPKVNNIPEEYIPVPLFLSQSGVCKYLKISSSRIRWMAERDEKHFQGTFITIQGKCKRSFLHPTLFEERLEQYPFRNRLEKEMLREYLQKKAEGKL